MQAPIIGEWLDRDFLVDYSARGREANDKLLKSLTGTHGDVKSLFKKRHKHLNEPVAKSGMGMSIWPQIPLYGTLVVHLSPFSAEHFGAYHGFGPSDINRLVDFAKDTGRIAFELEDAPEEYVGLDFLDPIFNELRPPVDISFNTILQCYAR